MRRVAYKRSGGGASGWRRPTENLKTFFSSNAPATDIVVILSTLAKLIIASGSFQLCCPVHDGKPTESLLRERELLAGASWYHNKLNIHAHPFFLYCKVSNAAFDVKKCI